VKVGSGVSCPFLSGNVRQLNLYLPLLVTPRDRAAGGDVWMVVGGMCERRRSGRRVSEGWMMG
jgi:hypothetical protein